MLINGVNISDNVSYSLLKLLEEEGPKALLKPKKESTKALKFGSLFDDFLFLDKETFNSKYEVLPIMQLDPMAIKLAHILRETCTLEDINKIKTDLKAQLDVVEIIKANKLWNNIKTDATFIKKFNFEDFYTYTETCFLDKDIIFTFDLLKLKEAKAALLSSNRTKHYLVNDLDNIYQLEINYPYKNQNIKTILDIVIIDHKNKIIKGVDLKTGTPKSEDFSKNFFSFKYYLQAALYQKALEYFNTENFKGEYTIEPFRFLYFSKTDIHNPLVYKVTNKWIDAGMRGFSTLSGYEYRGVDAIIEDLIWHKENKLFEYPRKLYESLELELEDFYINVKK